MINVRLNLKYLLSWGLLAATLCGAGPLVLRTFAADPGEAVAQQGPVKPNPEVLGLQESFARVASQIKPSVVNISTIIEEKGTTPYEFFFGSPFEEFFGPGTPPPERRRRAEGVASGVIISADGYILTNEHVVHGAKSIRVTLFDEKKYTGKVVGKDARTDLAVIKINAGKNLPFVKLGDSDKIKVGDWAIAIGSPFGLEETVTVGVISALRQSLVIEGNNYSNLIQTDAAINRGNSGGPLCDIYGEVIGINTAIYAPTGVFSGVGFAIPVNRAKEIMDSLIRKGKVVRGWLGIEIRPVDDVIARQFGLPDKSGALVNNVMPDSPAAKAGLQRGDVIREVNGKKVTSPQELQDIVAQTEPKKRMSIKIIRNRKEMTVQLVAGEMPSEQELAGKEQKAPPEEQPQEMETVEWQGAKVTVLTPALARKLDVDQDEKGCAVVDVVGGSAAEAMGVLPGDVIRAVNGTPTRTIKEFQAVTVKVKLSEGVVLDVNRQGRLVYLSFAER